MDDGSKTQIDTTTVIDRLPVASSTVKSIGYLNGLLDVEFKSGGVYRYANVPDSVHKAFVGSESIGKAHHATIKGKFPFVKLPRPAPPPEST